MRDRGVSPEPLRPRPGGRPGRRSDVLGWYLRSNGSLAVDVDGGYHVLDRPATPLARFRRFALTPTDPPLQVGRGARDGESIELAALLAHRLDQPG